ncbi:MAG: hypothetical protein LBI78_04530 [Campylobacteraceae bacterium]|nr:hypothetical protein [Campylobacteraceae bacterium]
MLEKQKLYNRSALFRIGFESNKEFSIKFEDENIKKIPKTIDGKNYTTIKLKKPKSIKREIVFEIYYLKYPKNTEKALQYVFK